jgi:hypothetical protein
VRFGTRQEVAQHGAEVLLIPSSLALAQNLKKFMPMLLSNLEGNHHQYHTHNRASPETRTFVAAISRTARLEVVVRNAKSEIIANVGAQIVALIVSSQHRVLHLEATCTSDAGAHALMGSVSDPRYAVEFRYYSPGKRRTKRIVLKQECEKLVNRD